MPSKTELQNRLEFREAALQAARTAYLALLNGQAKSYTIGSRQMTRLDLPQLKKEIDDLEKEIDSLRCQIDGGRSRTAVGILIRDW
jgi:hypothetical protein